MAKKLERGQDSDTKSASHSKRIRVRAGQLAFSPIGTAGKLPNFVYNGGPVINTLRYTYYLLATGTAQQMSIGPRDLVNSFQTCSTADT